MRGGTGCNWCMVGGGCNLHVVGGGCNLHVVGGGCNLHVVGGSAIHILHGGWGIQFTWWVRVGGWGGGVQFACQRLGMQFMCGGWRCNLLMETVLFSLLQSKSFRILQQIKKLAAFQAHYLVFQFHLLKKITHDSLYQYLNNSCKIWNIFGGNPCGHLAYD